MLPDRPFHIAVLGDFSGRDPAARKTDPASHRKPRVVDRDNFDEVLARVAPRLNDLRIFDEARIDLDFTTLDDFHPDRLYGKLEMFKVWQELRRRLEDPNTFAQAAAELRGPRGPEKPTPAAQQDPEGKAADPGAGEGSLLQRALKQTRQTRSADDTVHEVINWERFLRSYVDPISIAKADPELATLLNSVDQAAANMMRAVLHQPRFQAMEAAWRGLDFLVRRLETGTGVKVFLLDIAFEELESELASGDLKTSGVYKLLVEQAREIAGAVPWSLLVGNYEFQPSKDAFATLERLAQLAFAARAPLICGAGAEFTGHVALTQFAEQGAATAVQAAWLPQWNALRREDCMAFLGMAMPRLLLRRPYGRTSDPIEEFSFEEMSGSEHASYLWGNPCFAAACLLGQSVVQAGRAMQPGELHDISNLPVHTYEDDGESLIKACAEVYLTDTNAQQIADLGLMPLISFLNQPTVRWGTFRSVSADHRELSGPWDAA